MLIVNQRTQVRRSVKHRLLCAWDNTFPYVMFGCAVVYAILWHFGYWLLN